MTLHPRRDADHQLVLSTLAFLALDQPDFSHVIQGLVVILYGSRALQPYEAIQRQFEPAAPVEKR